MGKILVTGCAGFIGSHLCHHLLQKGKQVIGIDNFSNYYDKAIKKRNLAMVLSKNGFEFREMCISECHQLKDTTIDVIIHLAATPGVVPSMHNIQGYIENNINRYVRLLEYAKSNAIRKFIFASSSSVYGNQNVSYYKESLPLNPLSPYGLTKQVGEQLNYQYHQIYGFSFLNLRLFSVYGSRMRPDLAFPKFLDALLNQQTLTLYNNGKDYRDFTHVHDVASAFCSAVEYITAQELCYETLNIGSQNPIQINRIIELLEQITHTKAICNYAQKRQGEALYTAADISKAQQLLNYIPLISIDTGIREYYEWFKRVLTT